MSDILVESLFNVLFSLITVKSGLHEKPRKEYWITEKVHRRICLRDITSLTARPPFYVIFCCFLCLLMPPSQVTCLLNGPYIAMAGILCNDTMSDRSALPLLPPFSTALWDGKKKLLWCRNRDNSLKIWWSSHVWLLFKKCKSSHRRCSIKKFFLKIFTGK